MNRSHLSLLESGRAPSIGQAKRRLMKDKDADLHNYVYYKQRRLPSWLKRALLLAGILLLLCGYLPFLGFFRSTPDTDMVATPVRQPPSALVEQRDQILLYRIIGNDLPPRHKEGQTLSNLQFILEHEPDFPNTRKFFVLNRIYDPRNEATIIRLLDQHGMDYIRIPFVEHEYRPLDFRLEDFPQPDFLHSDDYRRFSKVSKLRALDYTYHDKNLYAMNNNGGRNTAIQHGREVSDAKWIMPFDGNCFLSRNAFEEISTQLERHGEDTKYFVVPMARLLNNSVLLNDMDERPKAPEEPQVIFRFDAQEEYSLNMRYGRRSKLELLWRLGALENRRLLSRPTVPWEVTERPYSDDKGKFRTIGWVFRLFSGNPLQEENKKEASSIRAFNRLLAIQSSLDQLDETIARQTFRSDRPFLLHAAGMAEARLEYWRGNENVIQTVQRLCAFAEEIVGDAKAALTPSETLSPPSTADRIPQLGLLSRNVTILTLAQYFADEEVYGRWAANLIRAHVLHRQAVTEEDEQDIYTKMRHVPPVGSGDSHLLDFLSDQGYSFPSLHHLRSPRYTNGNTGLSPALTPDWIIMHSTGMSSKTDVSLLLDSLRMLRTMRQFKHKEYLDLQAIAGALLEQLVTSPAGIHLAQMNDHRGVLYDLQVISLAAFTDDIHMFLRVANRCRMRVGKQFLEDGSQPFQTMAAEGRLSLDPAIIPSARATWRANLHYETLSLHYWTVLARAIQTSGAAKDIWHYTAQNGGRISHAVVSHLQKYATQRSSLSKADSHFLDARLRPLIHLAQSAYMEAEGETPTIREELDWITRSTDVFGTRWQDSAKEDNDIEDRHDSDASLKKFMLYISEDSHEGKLNIPPFWMLGNV